MAVFFLNGVTFSFCYYVIPEVSGLSELLAYFSVPHKVDFSAVR